MINLSERNFYWIFIPSLADSPSPYSLHLEFQLESVQNPVGAGCSRVLGVYRHMSAGTCNVVRIHSQPHLADAAQPGDPAVASKLQSRRSSSPAASASRLSGQDGGGEGVQAQEWGPSSSSTSPEE